MASQLEVHTAGNIDSSEVEGVDLEDLDLDYDSFDEGEGERPGERWAPLGAAHSPTPSYSEPGPSNHSDDLARLEEEQEQLNNSLLSLTTHFAQVQFRLKQIVSAEPDDKETLLKELEEFAFKGIPDVRGGCTAQVTHNGEETSDKEHQDKIIEQREKQKELIVQLKSQLEDLETYAYETGDADALPTSKVMEKQKVVLEELRHKLDLNLENFDSLSADELREIVDNAVGQIVNPAKVKGKLVEQLKTQIVDLERFVDFLQGEADTPGPLGKERCLCPMHAKEEGCHIDHSKEPSHKKKSKDHGARKKKGESDKIQQESATVLMKKALTILQIYMISHLGCGSRDTFQKNQLKKTTKGNHWGDLRAKLEIAVTRCIELAEQQKVEAKHDTDSEEYDSDSDSTQPLTSPALTLCVRKQLSMAIRDLIEHGLMEMGQSRSLVPFGCLPSRSASAHSMMHAWDLFLKFYEMKHGREYNESPARMLSQSFHLDNIGGKPITAKQTLLGAIATVISSHRPLKRSDDSQIKAFVCMALNERKLVTWLRLLFRTQTLIDNYYQDWSYVARTGFDDALKSLERLLVISFNLPVDLAVRPFSNIKDAF